MSRLKLNIGVALRAAVGAAALPQPELISESSADHRPRFAVHHPAPLLSIPLTGLVVVDEEGGLRLKLLWRARPVSAQTLLDRHVQLRAGRPLVVCWRGHAGSGLTQRLH